MDLGSSLNGDPTFTYQFHFIFKQKYIEQMYVYTYIVKHEIINKN